jgi:signal transduction histidine kinase
VLRTVIPLRHGDEIVGVLSTTRDITDVVELERSLASARRLETIGQLSAGVAHEINTPVQYVTDNTAFLDHSFGNLLGAVRALSELAEVHDPEAVALIRKEADLDFLLEDIPTRYANPARAPIRSPTSSGR